MNREAWLQKAVETLESLFPGPVPDVHVSVGWPSSGGLSQKRRTVGQCWSSEASEDGLPHIYISPVLGDPFEVLHVLVHELVHATVGTEAGHKGEFIKLAREVGLVKPWTATGPGEELTAHLYNIIEELPDYPHRMLSPTDKKRKVGGTRMIKLTCPDDGYSVRTTKKWIEVGFPVCPCGKELKHDDS